MKIGRTIKVVEFEPKIIPITIPERKEEPVEAPATPEPERIAVPNWPSPVTVPQKV